MAAPNGADKVMLNELYVVALWHVRRCLSTPFFMILKKAPCANCLFLVRARRLCYTFFMQKLNRNHLKLIACATMLVDHIAYVLHLRGAAFIVMRGIIGRIAFPLFGFLLVEGFFHTRSRWKYVLRIAVLAVLSEVPYDLLFYRQHFYWQNQNVLFLLALGLLALAGLEYIRAQKQMHFAVAIALQAAVAVAAATIAQLLHFDYGFAGIAMIVVMYVAKGTVELHRGTVDSSRQSLDESTVPLCNSTVPFATSSCVLIGAIALNLVMFLTAGSATPGALLAVIPALFYNNRRGKIRAKYAFYLFYPAHILLLLFLS